MSPTGVVYQDLLPVPSSEQTNLAHDGYQHESQLPRDPQPTKIPALIDENHGLVGLAEEDHTFGVHDVGWNEQSHGIQPPFLGGIENEDLWLLLRRFNKQIYHVKETNKSVPGNLDVNIASEDNFSPIKLRSTIERLYMTVIVGLIGLSKHVVRLRSWHEKRRTASFAIVYFATWWYNILMPISLLIIATMIAFPSSRDFLFPKVPIAMTDGSNTNGVQKRKNVLQGSYDSATGAPENHKGECVEAEASHFVQGIAHILLSAASGGNQDEPEPGEVGILDSIPDPTQVALNPTKGNGDQDEAIGKSMETTISNKMRPMMHSIAVAADNWERFGNALDPVPPFSLEAPRLRLAGFVVLMICLSSFLTAHMFVKGITFIAGFGFFGDPITIPAATWLDSTFPNWAALLQIRNTILKGIPTNAQLTLTLLRIGEANQAPIPPPHPVRAPTLDKVAGMANRDLDASDHTVGSLPGGLQAAMGANQGAAAHSNDDDDTSVSDRDVKKTAWMFGLVQRSFTWSVRSAVGMALKADRLKASTGSASAKNRLGVAGDVRNHAVSGPSNFEARYHGKKGYVNISTEAAVPYVAFTVNNDAEMRGLSSSGTMRPIWTIPASGIRELRKVGGYGWKTRFLVEWALQKDVTDGIEITDHRGSVWKVMALPMRDELFNRLVSCGSKKWEHW